jgi:hypothetical protein
MPSKKKKESGPQKYSVACLNIPKYLRTPQGFQFKVIDFGAAESESAIFSDFWRKRRQNQMHLLLRTSPSIICESSQ